MCYGSFADVSSSQNLVQVKEIVAKIDQVPDVFNLDVVPFVGKDEVELPQDVNVRQDIVDLVCYLFVLAEDNRLDQILEPFLPDKSLT